MTDTAQNKALATKPTPKNAGMEAQDQPQQQQEEMRTKEDHQKQKARGCGEGGGFFFCREDKPPPSSLVGGGGRILFGRNQQKKRSAVRNRFVIIDLMVCACFFLFVLLARGADGTEGPVSSLLLPPPTTTEEVPSRAPLELSQSIPPGILDSRSSNSNKQKVLASSKMPRYKEGIPLMDMISVVDEASTRRILTEISSIQQDVPGCDIQVVLADDLSDDWGAVSSSNGGTRTAKGFATALFNQWGIGGGGNTETKNNAGVLVLFLLDTRRVEIEVGASLDQHMDNEWTTSMLMQRAIPEFKQGNFGFGIYNIVAGIADRLRDIQQEDSPALPLPTECNKQHQSPSSLPLSSTHQQQQQPPETCQANAATAADGQGTKKKKKARNGDKKAAAATAAPDSLGQMLADLRVILAIVAIFVAILGLCAWWDYCFPMGIGYVCHNCGQSNWRHDRWKDLRPETHESEGLRLRYCICNICQARDCRDETIPKLMSPPSPHQTNQTQHQGNGAETSYFAKKESAPVAAVPPASSTDQPSCLQQQQEDSTRRDPTSKTKSCAITAKDENGQHNTASDKKMSEETQAAAPSSRKRTGAHRKTPSDNAKEDKKDNKEEAPRDDNKRTESSFLRRLLLPQLLGMNKSSSTDRTSPASTSPAEMLEADRCGKNKHDRGAGAPTSGGSSRQDGTAAGADDIIPGTSISSPSGRDYATGDGGGGASW